MTDSKPKTLISQQIAGRDNEIRVNEPLTTEAVTWSAHVMNW